ncbi:winged helix-turn-helix domain-containing protein [Sphingomonas sp.]|uniref:winged helix-turn-helix domain-containing protein n=1 Tax=Sphingomonas sp. TaxID=28214 RepID=UPI00286B312C|nr:winged helix-turn-helix domain-containing protein [Sphingomonas sp.]
MNIERKIGSFRIGSWDFYPATGELRRGPDLRRLEPRAARTLELLREAEGAVISQEQLIAGVWNGRNLSENSVAVVIGQLRRALGDDAREPRLIETIPKRGYRLAATIQPRPQRATRWPIVIALAAIAGLLLLLVAPQLARPSAVEVGMADVVNATSERAYDPVVRATSELIVADLSKRGFSVRRGGRSNTLNLTGRLVMWNGAPSLGMSATDSSGVVVWSAMINGTAATIPAGVAHKLDEFQARFGRR